LLICFLYKIKPLEKINLKESVQNEKGIRKSDLNQKLDKVYHKKVKRKIFMILVNLTNQFIFDVL